MLIVYGPTGVGKSDMASMIAQHMPAEIVNADMGQMYTPLSIGTAKPRWQSEPVKHHLFDVLHEPFDCTVVQYRQMLRETLQDIWARGKFPIVVGGSGFYVKSIVFPPAAGDNRSVSIHGTWDELHAIDPVRASKIHPHDSYRISRALSIWHTYGVLPSSCTCKFDPLARAHILWVGRTREQLYERIDKRVKIMVEDGWIEECKPLLNTPWEDFLHRKKLIGYPEILDCVRGSLNLDAAVIHIAQKTRAYAKRQETFWRMLKRSLASELDRESISYEELDLTLSDPYLYINQLLHRLSFVLR